MNSPDPITELLTVFCNQFNEKCQLVPVPESPKINAALAILNKKLQTLLMMQECGIVPENCPPSLKPCFLHNNKTCSLDKMLQTLLLMKEFGIVPENCHPSWKQYFQTVDK